MRKMRRKYSIEEQIEYQKQKIRYHEQKLQYHKQRLEYLLAQAEPELKLVKIEEED